MIYTIACQVPGYLRLRAPRYYLNDEDAHALMRAIRQLPDIDSAEVNAFSGSILVKHRGDGDHIRDAICRMNAKTLPRVPDHEKDHMVEITRTFRATMAKSLVMRFVSVSLMPAPLRMALTIWNAAHYVKAGLKSLLAGRIDVDVLDGAAVGLSVAFGHYASASQIMFLLHISDILENYARKRSRNALSMALVFDVDQVWVRSADGVERQKQLIDVQLDDAIVIRQGSMIAVDGEVIEGIAEVNQASMTGESAPVTKEVGDRVYAGTAIAAGDLLVRPTRLPSESRISSLIAMVEQAEAAKSKTAARAEALADRIVPYSFLFAALTWIFTRNGHKALSALTVDYSCAIKLATPIAVISALNEASQSHIMVKGGKYLEQVAEAEVVVFDKTGTLTQAVPKVAEVLPLAGHPRDEVLRLAACLEEHFPHSLARAICRQAEEEDLHHREEHTEVEYVVAHGIVSQWRGHDVAIGSKHFLFDDRGIIIDEAQQKQIDALGNDVSLVYLALDDALIGVIAIEDPPRPEAAEVITALRELGVKEIVMLTGDGPAVAESMAKRLGVDRVFSEVLPEQKASLVEALQNEGKSVMMVGDGVNDTPALAQADVSVSLRDSSDIAREVADVTLLGANLWDLVDLRRASRTLMCRIETNFYRIFGFNTLLLIAGATGVMQPTTTALLHNLSTAGIGYMASRPLWPHRPRQSLDKPATLNQ